MARGISLRQFKPEDADAVYRWFNSPAATANLLEHRDDFSEEDARRWVERAIEQSGDESAEDRKWAIVVLTNLKAFEEFGAHKVYGRIPATNEAAKKAVIYNGWKQEGVLRNHVRRGEELIDVELWGGFREDLPEPPED